MNIIITESQHKLLMENNLKKSSKFITIEKINKYTPSNHWERKIEVGDRTVYLHNVDANTVQEVLNDLPKSIKMLGVKNCEGVDFSNVNLCDHSNLIIVIIKGTPNNFEESIDCEYKNLGGGVYEFPNPL